MLDHLVAVILRDVFKYTSDEGPPLLNDQFLVEFNVVFLCRFDCNNQIKLFFSVVFLNLWIDSLATDSVLRLKHGSIIIGC